MKMKNVILTTLSIAFILTGCADNKNISRSELLNKQEPLNQIFSKMLYKNDTYSYIYQIYLTKRGKYIDDSKILNNLHTLCENRGGKVMFINDFLSQYKLDSDSVGDRCFINPQLAINELCVIPKQIPKILFGWEDNHKINTHLHFNYVNTVNVGGVRSAYISNTPTGVIATHTAVAKIKVCMPDQKNWIYFFKSSQKAYLAKQKIIKQRKLQKEKQKNDDGFRRF